MIFNVITLFPEVFEKFLRCSIIGRALERDLARVQLINLRDYAHDKHKTCDDYPYGGGAGMVLKAEPVALALKALGIKKKRIIYPSASGKLLTQDKVAELSNEKELIIVCGHYEGIDQRIIDTYITDEVSIGNYIVSAGETAAMVIIDAVTRLLKGAISEDSLEEESFQHGLLEYPQYTRPREILGLKVPDVLLSGNHKEIKKWRLEQSLKKTVKNRPDLVKEFDGDVKKK
ncbi:MAG: tRNA (guanosine(37)-N1)-methyltransferase TrmD [Spirochaetales bacterium]|nr:tRNA (guanosine(37)-N1)-methyltransferase TrmD [Spirochaetales bacterium]